jgi:hypothetical protein
MNDTAWKTIFGIIARLGPLAFASQGRQRSTNEQEKTGFTLEMNRSRHRHRNTPMTKHVDDIVKDRKSSIRTTE